MRIISIETQIPSMSGFDITKTDILSNATLIDAELILWDMSKSEQKLPVNLFNLTALKRETYDNLAQGFATKQKEFEEFFKMGRTLVLFSPSFNAHNFNIINSEDEENVSLSILDCLPISHQEIESISGKSFSSNNIDGVENFLSMFHEYFSYEYKYSKYNGTPLFFIKETNYVVSQFFKIQNGLIICLPILSDISNNIALSRQFINEILVLSKNLQKYNDPKLSSYPAWVKNYAIFEEERLNNELKESLMELNLLNQNIEQQKDKLEHLNELKILFSGDSDNLELIAAKIFNEMGFKLIETEPNRDDLIIIYGDRVAVVEIKGVNKSSAEKHAAQLQKWVSNYHIDHDINPKGILLVNTYKEMPIEERNGEDFPAQMLSYAQRMNHCLISGLQFLCMYIDFVNKKISQSELINLLFNTVGILEYTNNPSEYIKKLSDEQHTVT